MRFADGSDYWKDLSALTEQRPKGNKPLFAEKKLESVLVVPGYKYTCGTSTLVVPGYSAATSASARASPQLEPAPRPIAKAKPEALDTLGAGTGPPAKGALARQIAKVCAMGFSQPDAAAALQRANGVEAAVELLLSGFTAQPTDAEKGVPDLVGALPAALAEPEPEPELEPQPELAQQQGSRLRGDREVAISSLPTTKWTAVRPAAGCVDGLLSSKRIRSAVPSIAPIAADIRVRVTELRFAPVPVLLDDDCAAAIIAYTHDLNQPDKRGNLYFELNKMLRQRGAVQRAELMKTWGDYMFYMMSGLD